MNRKILALNLALLALLGTLGWMLRAHWRETRAQELATLAKAAHAKAQLPPPTPTPPEAVVPPDAAVPPAAAVPCAFLCDDTSIICLSLPVPYTWKTLSPFFTIWNAIPSRMPPEMFT